VNLLSETIKRQSEGSTIKVGLAWYPKDQKSSVVIHNPIPRYEIKIGKVVHSMEEMKISEHEKSPA
jgi:hypothetical protein